jgi:hypothetical protein
MRLLIRLATVGFAVLFAILAAFYLYIDVIAGASIEKGATYALGVESKVGFVRVGLLTGSFRIGSLEVANPPGFDAKHILKLGDGRLDVSLDSLQNDVVEIPDFALEGIDVALEKAQGKTNFGVILANLKRFESKGSKPAPTESEEAGPGKRFIVRELAIRDISAHVEHTEALGDLGAINVAVPEIRLTNIGAHNAEGVALSELTNIIMKAIFEAIAKHGANLPGAFAGELRNGLGGLSNVSVQVVGSTADSVAEKLPAPVTDSARQLGGEASEKARQGLGGLFGDKKSDE